MKSKTLIVSLIFISVFGLSESAFVRPVMAQEPFDTYETFISWKYEKANLDNFAIFLMKHPETIGYVVFYTGDKDSFKKVNKRITKSKRYLIDRRKIANGRLIVIYAGTLAKFSTTILQPMDANLPPPYKDVRTKRPS